MLANFQRIIELFTKKIVKKLLKYMVWGSGIRDPRSGIRDPEKTYSGSRIQGSKSTQSRIPDPQHCKKYIRGGTYTFYKVSGYEEQLLIVVFRDNLTHTNTHVTDSTQTSTQIISELVVPSGLVE
jgi:hypothetical protein